MLVKIKTRAIKIILIFRFDKRHFEIFIGKQDFDKSSSAVIHRRIKSWTVHEDFNTYNLDNDIAVIELDRSIPVGGAIRTACLPENRKNFFVNFNGKIQNFNTFQFYKLKLV